MLKEEASFLGEASPTNSAGTGGFSGSATDTGPVVGFDPVLISLIRRAMPNLVAYDLAGVQPMSGPTGLIFAMRSRYTNQSGTEALFDDPNTAFAGQNDGGSLTAGQTDQCWFRYRCQAGTNPAVLNPVGSATTSAYNVGQGMTTGESELSEMVLTTTSTKWHSRSRRSPLLRSPEHWLEYSLELAQDLKAIHGLNAEVSWQTFSPQRFLLKSTAKSFVPSTRLLNRVQLLTPLPLVSSTSMLTPTDAGRLRSSRVYSSKSKETLTRSPKELVEEGQRCSLLRRRCFRTHDGRHPGLHPCTQR